MIGIEKALSIMQLSPIFIIKLASQSLFEERILTKQRLQESFRERCSLINCFQSLGEWSANPEWWTRRWNPCRPLNLRLFHHRFSSRSSDRWKVQDLCLGWSCWVWRSGWIWLHVCLPECRNPCRKHKNRDHAREGNSQSWYVLFLFT